MPTVEHSTALNRFDFHTVIDIGANKGQFAAFAQRAWPRARYFGFEPLKEPRQTLTKLLKGDVKVFSCALGAQSGSQEIRIASRADSSSLLPIGSAQTALFGTVERNTRQVTVKRLDEVLTITDIAAPCLLKIDVQGFELHVLQGATALLQNVDAVYVEASYVELYQGQALFDDVRDLLIDRGFELTGIFNETRAPDIGPVQADFLFVLKR